MAITFIEQKKKQKYLFIALIGLLLLIFFVFQKEFLAKPKLIDPFIEEEIPEQEKIKINFEALKSPWLQELEPFEQSVSVEQGEEVGRENPFLPY